MLHYAMRHILDPTSPLFYMDFDYQSLSLLYSKRSLWDSCLANSQAIPEQMFNVRITLRVMACCEIMHTVIALLLEHGTMSFQYHE